MAPEQDWCLECGEAVTTRVARPPGWGVPVAIVVAALLVAGAAVFVTIGALSDDADNAAGPAGGSSRAAATTPARMTPAARTAPTKRATRPAAKRTTAAKPAAARRAVPLWPRTQRAYTIVVGAPNSRAAAQGRARALIAHGRDAGILRSDDYDFFGPGLWVVWRGKYPNRAAADRKAPEVKQVYPSAYVTYVRSKSS